MLQACNAAMLSYAQTATMHCQARGIQMMTFRLAREFVFVLATGAFLFLNFLTINADDITVYYADDITQALVSNNLSNYRYMGVAIASVLSGLGGDYLSAIGFFCVALPAALLLCAHQLLLVLKLPSTWLIPASLAILFHGLWADLYHFTMAYANFALALLFTALCLACVRRCERGSMSFLTLAVLFGLATLCSYQPFLLVLPLTAGLIGLKSVSSPPTPEDRSIALGAFLILVFGASCVLFLLVASGCGAGREVSFANISKNIVPYFVALFEQVFSHTVTFHKIYPLHERATYGLIVPVAGVFVFLAQVRRRTDRVVLLSGASAFLAAAMLAPGPFNLFASAFWPSGRSTSPIAFFHVMTAAIIGAYVIHEEKIAGIRLSVDWKLSVPIVVAVFVTLSAANQITLLAERVRQSRQDWAIADSILAGMRQQKALRHDQEVAIFATWRNAAQLNRAAFQDYGLSAFSRPWSSLAMLRLVSGVRLKKSEVPESVCSDFMEPFEVRRHDEALVVCMK